VKSKDIVCLLEVISAKISEIEVGLAFPQIELRPSIISVEIVRVSLREGFYAVRK
jgi:hypothetical protein